MAWYRERWLEHPEGILDPVTVATVPDDIFTNYKALCQGQILRDVVETSRLKCFWRITRIPVLRSKEEVLSYDPRVSIYHDVISDAESKIVMDIASSKLQRSMTLKPDGNPGSTDNDQRISQTAWLPDETSPIVRKLSRRVSSIINMDMDQRISQSGCEELQILNYGVGGMYEPHYDYLQIPDEADTREGDPANVYNSGDRIATWLFYMTDVEAGGYTVFPNIKVQVPVTKGGAAFWYNLKRNGEMDPRTLHAGCPILLGSKWVCNKWIRSRNQMFRRPCGLSVDALDGPQS